MQPVPPNVRPGDPELPAFQAIARYDQAVRLQSGANVRRRVQPNGTSLSIDEPAALWLHPFKVSLSGLDITVRLGLVNAIVPLMAGTPLDDPAPPTLTVEGGPDSSLRSWIVLQVAVDKYGVIQPDEDDAAVILHTNVRPGTGGQRPDTGTHVLAMLVWQDELNIARVHQVTHHGLQHAYVPRLDTRPQRHLFWAV